MTHPKEQQLVCTKGKRIFEQGTPAHEAYFVESGRVAVSIAEKGHTVQIAEIGPGEIFGEMGILEKEMRMATVTATQNTVLTVITKEYLEQRIGKLDDRILRSLIMTLIKRLRAAGHEQVRHYRNLVAFQNRMASLSDKADTVIAASARESFMAEVMPVLDHLDEILEKYRS